MTFVLRRCFWMVDLGFLAAAASLCALLVGSLVSPTLHNQPMSFAFSGSPSIAKTALDAKAVSQVLGLPLDGSLVENTVKVSETITSALSVKLLGTSVANVADLSLATMQDLVAKDTAVYAIGDSIQGATIIAIERLRVTVDNQGRRETIDLEQSIAAPAIAAPSAPASSSATSAAGPVSRVEIEKFLGDPKGLFFSPAYDGGQMRGWKLQRLSADSPLAKLGFAQGDVIRRLNGFELSNPSKLLEAYSRLTSTSRAEVEIDRNGAPQRLTYRITD